MESEIAKEDLEAQLQSPAFAGIAGGGGTGGEGAPKQRICFAAHPDSISSMIGNRSSNRRYFEEKYPQLSIRFAADKTLRPGQYIVRTDA